MRRTRTLGRRSNCFLPRFDVPRIRRCARYSKKTAQAVEEKESGGHAWLEWRTSGHHAATWSVSTRHPGCPKRRSSGGVGWNKTSKANSKQYVSRKLACRGPAETSLIRFGWLEVNRDDTVGAGQMTDSWARCDFKPAEARRIAKRLEFHYTSTRWLNMAGSERIQQPVSVAATPMGDRQWGLYTALPQSKGKHLRERVVA